MPKSVTINGVARDVPLPGEAGFDQGLDDTLNAMLSGLVQADGSVAVSGWKQKTAAAPVAASGWARLANTARISWRNSANKGDMSPGPDADGNLIQTVSDALGLSDRPISAPTVVRLAGANTSTLSNATATLKFPSVQEDPLGIWNGTTGEFTFVKPGLYLFMLHRTLLTQTAGTGIYTVTMNPATSNLKNGSTTLYTFVPVWSPQSLSTTVTSESFDIHFPLYVPPNCTAVIEFQEVVVAAQTATMSTANDLNYCHVLQVPL